MDVLVLKAAVVVRACVAFMLMSTVTALTVRTLLSSGVVIIFPLVIMIERFGLGGSGMHVSSTQPLSVGNLLGTMMQDLLRAPIWAHVPVGPTFYVLGQSMKAVG